MGKSEKGLHESERQKKDPEETKKPSMEQLLKLTWGCASMEELESILTSYLSELEPCARISGSAIASANEKKQKILQRLIIFNSIYENIPKPKYDFDYFRKMSDLLVHYITLEVFTFRTSEPFKCETEDIKNLISRIVTTMYVSLGFSEDHILDTVMKLVVSVDEKTPKKDFSIYSELFKIVVRKAEKQQVNDFTYIRYILVYRLWKKIMKVQAGSDQSIDEISKLKDTIFKKAKVLLPPPGFTKKLRVLPSVLPKLPPEVLEQPPSCITDFFLRVKFSVRKAVEKFLEVSYDGAMFPNLSCNPILLNPKPRDSVFLGPSDPIQEFSTVMHAGDDIWQRLHDERLSETSVFLQAEDGCYKGILLHNSIFHPRSHSLLFRFPLNPDHFCFFVLQWIFKVF